MRKFYGLITKALAGADLTEAFKTKGDLKRWSAKRTVGGMIATTACYDLATHGISFEAACFCVISTIPLSVSLLARNRV